MYWSIRKKVDQSLAFLNGSRPLYLRYGDSYTLDSLSSGNNPVTHITVTAFTITFVQYRYFLCLMHP